MDCAGSSTRTEVLKVCSRICLHALWQRSLFFSSNNDSSSFAGEYVYENMADFWVGLEIWQRPCGPNFEISSFRATRDWSGQRSHMNYLRVYDGGIQIFLLQFGGRGFKLQGTSWVTMVVPMPTSFFFREEIVNQARSESQRDTGIRG